MERNYCADCNQLSDETEWSEYYRARLCIDCYCERSYNEAFECDECEEI